MVWFVIMLLAGANSLYSISILERYPLSEWKPGAQAAGWVSSLLGNVAFLLSTVYIISLNQH